MVNFGTNIRRQINIVLFHYLILHRVGGVEYPCRFGAGHGRDEAWWSDDDDGDGSLQFPSYGPPVRNHEDTSMAAAIPCRYFEDIGDVVCTDALDFDFLRHLNGKHIRTLILASYNKKDSIQRRVLTPSALVKSSVHKITGQVHLRDIHIELYAIVDFRQLTWDRFGVTGELFSNRIIKIGWKFRGEAVRLSWWDFRVRATASEDEWSLDADISLHGRISGNVTSPGGTPQVIPFEGLFKGNATWFDGQLLAREVNVGGDFSGRLTKKFSAEVTIPQGAFSYMDINHLVFTDSHFFGDFHSHSLEGINSLETIRFSHSRMEFMPRYDRVFRGPDLRAIFVEDCSTPNIETGHECNVKRLEFLSFKGSGFLEFSGNSFHWLSCSNLTYLNFRGTNFKLIGNESILQPVADTLKRLDVSYSTLTQEPSLRQLLSHTRITHLSLAGLQLKRVPTSALDEVKNTLEYLSLRKNNFEKIPGENMLIHILNFPQMTALRDLDLRGCRINYVEKRAFDSLPSLRYLDLSHNNIANLQDGWSAVQPQLAHLNLSHNGIATPTSAINMLDVKDSTDLRVFDRLETLDLSDSDFWRNKRLIANLSNNLRFLSLCKCGLRTLNESIFREIPNLEELDLGGNPDLGKTFQLGQLNHMKSLRRLHLVRSGIVNLADGNGAGEGDGVKMESLEYIDASNNYIKVVRPEFFLSMPNLRTLKLSRNSISYWPKALFTNVSSLQVVHLDNNKIDTMKLSSVSDMGGMTEFTLGGNPFVCGCYVLEFVRGLWKTDKGYYLCPEFINRTEDVVAPERRFRFAVMSAWRSRSVYRYRRACAKIPDWSDSEYQCYLKSVRSTVPFTAVDEEFEECQKEIIAGYFDWVSLIVTITLLFCFFIGFVWWKWWNIKIFTKMLRNAAILSFMDEDGLERTNFEYDAFVSYTDKDREWVTDELIPNLEKLTDIKICLHERDFQVGLSILENIITSIDKSRTIILVLSRAFVKSQWCQYEMHLAYHRLLETRRDQMILILLEDIPRHKRPRTLHYLMMSKTYIQWPSDSSDVKETNLFWSRLFKALMHIHQM